MSAGLYTAEDWARFFEIHAEHGGNVTVDAAQALKIAAFLRASVVAEEPEWEYGACYQADNGREMLWFSMGNSGFVIREAAEKEVERYSDAQIKLCRRRKAGPWVPVEQEKP